MKLFLLLITFSVSVLCFSQTDKTEKPNYKKINKDISKKDGLFFYKTLLEKYQTGDTTLNLQEKRHLYYGWTYQSSYSPYGSSDYSDSIKILFNKTNLNENDYKNIIRYSDLLLQENPFNLRALNYALFAGEKTDKKDFSKKKLVQLNIIIDAVLSSGDGLKKETAFYVTYIEHEYDILNIIGFEFGGSQSLIEHYDYLKVKNNKYNINGFYFDVSPCLNHLSQIFK